MGAVTGDFNNDGCVDLYVTTLERSQLLRNDCDGTLTDVSAQSGAEDRGWSVSEAFVDYDRDAWLDLFVGNDVNWSLEVDKPCLHPIGSLVDYWPPSLYPAHSRAMSQPAQRHVHEDGAASAQSPYGGFARPVVEKA